jgi:hypothetical protein
MAASGGSDHARSNTMAPPAGEDTTPPPADGRARSAAARLDRPSRGRTIIDIDATVQSNLGPIVIGLSVAVVVLTVAVVVLALRIRAVDGRLGGLTRGETGGSLEAVLDAHLERVATVVRDVDRLAGRTAALETASRRAFSRVGLVRYNPFEETGGNQSFALALLDVDGNGWVLSSLHARSGTRVYAKAITAGRADAALSEEESAAIRQANA